ncbi:MAG: tetratricopeptide repeat protein [Emcibacteraceae bacterium]|nr:tetratricopeptide repeat protein [Emcibacteraceae bacterium]
MRNIIIILGWGLLSFSTSLADIDDGKEAYYMGDYQRAISEFTPLAEGGNVFALMKLGFMSENGWGTVKNYTAAMDYYKQAALLGDGEGYISIAKQYAYGKGVKKSEELANDNLLRAVELGEHHAYYILGDIYNDFYALGEHPSVALKWYLKAAENNAAAYSRNGHYTPGTGQWFRLLSTEGVRLTRIAADAGNIYAQFNTGLRYYYGEGVEADYKIAEAYFLMAAINGIVEAQKLVGEAHAMENPVNTNNVYVNTWFTIASHGGNKQAKLFKEKLESNMSEEDIDASHRAANEWINENTE